MSKKKMRDYGDTVETATLSDALDEYFEKIEDIEEIPEGHERILTYDPSVGNVFRIRPIRKH